MISKFKRNPNLYAAPPFSIDAVIFTNRTFCLIFYSDGVVRLNAFLEVDEEFGEDFDEDF